MTGFFTSPVSRLLSGFKRAVIELVEDDHSPELPQTALVPPPVGFFHSTMTMNDHPILESHQEDKNEKMAEASILSYQSVGNGRLPSSLDSSGNNQTKNEIRSNNVQSPKSNLSTSFSEHENFNHKNIHAIPTNSSDPMFNTFTVNESAKINNLRTMEKEPPTMVGRTVQSPKIEVMTLNPVTEESDVSHTYSNNNNDILNRPRLTTQKSSKAYTLKRF